MSKEKLTREQKGEILFKENKVSGSFENGFEVRGSNGNKYVVIFEDEHGDKATCDCTDFNVRQTFCKHCWASLLLLRKQHGKEESKTEGRQVVQKEPTLMEIKEQLDRIDDNVTAIMRWIVKQQ